jgi:hypothetical protein
VGSLHGVDKLTSTACSLKIHLIETNNFSPSSLLHCAASSTGYSQTVEGKYNDA